MADEELDATRVALHDAHERVLAYKARAKELLAARDKEAAKKQRVWEQLAATRSALRQLLAAVKSGEVDELVPALQNAARVLVSDVSTQETTP